MYGRGKIRSDGIKVSPDGNVRPVSVMHSNEVEQTTYSTTLLYVGNGIPGQKYNQIQQIVELFLIYYVC